MSALELDIRFILAFLAPSIAFGFWFVRRWFEDRRHRDDQSRRKNNIIRALYSEIDFNTADMELFLEKSPSAGVLKEALEVNPKLVPHVTDARHTVLYTSLIGDIYVISDGLMAKIVLFYGYLEKIRVQVEGLNYPSFATLSPNGKFNAVDVIRRSAFDAKLSGYDLLRALEAEYPKLNLRRHKRLEGESDETIRERKKAFEHKLSQIKQ